ncbi:hypothetical protein HF325_001378 [Metschnikowia pulcherrima]|uniref:GATA-type domain-containing protein n=1 Tax=Metschnikowia pulcherrima TaxID=27326 RepID=A0A8H7LDU2_9ASCO|nr:hypothetical protein HF325_001378 [Metschnikowia pulcherrima]
MYDSSWEKASRSSHPNLWSPPLVTPMSRGAMSEPESALQPHFPPPGQAADPRQQRLPSVDEILFKIRHQETFRVPAPHETHLVPAQFPPQMPQVFHTHEQQPHIEPWQHAMAHTNEYHFDPRMGYDPRGPPAHDLPHFLPPPPMQLPPPPKPPGTAKKRGRKKKQDTICSHCQLTQTPEWRRGPDGLRTLCNACGLFYLKLTKKFGFDDANMIFAHKKRHGEVQDRIVPTTQQKNRYLDEARQQ